MDEYFRVIGHEVTVPARTANSRNKITDWPIQELSLFDSAAGKSFLFQKLPESTWTSDFGQLYLGYDYTFKGSLIRIDLE